MEDLDLRLECGTGIIDVFAHQALSHKQILSEFIDNSLGAGATAITIVRSAGSLVISDNGRGCPEPKAFFSLATSHRHPGDRSGRFGYGGTHAQIKGSRKGLSTVATVHGGVKVVMSVHWAECLADGVFRTKTVRRIPAGPGEAGTTITLKPCIEFNNPAQLARDLGYLYSREIRAGLKLHMEIDGKPYPVEAYAPPPSAKTKKFAFDLDGSRITGHCRLVRKGKPNPYPGFSVHLGYRYLGRFAQPADGGNVARVYAEVDLPEGWKNNSPTKDAFETEPVELWQALANECREILDAAQDDHDDSSLRDTTQAVEAFLSGVLSAKGGNIKGARPGTAGRKGTIKPTGEGGEHRNFTTSQPGGKVPSDVTRHPGEPSRIRVEWKPLDTPFTIEAGGITGRTLVITLDSGDPHMATFRGVPGQLGVLCLNMLAHWIAVGTKEPQRFFPELADQGFQEVFKSLLARIPTPPPAPGAEQQVA